MSTVTLLWGLVVSMWLHDFLKTEFGLEDWAAILIEAALSAAVGAFVFVYMVPELNKLFEGAPMITDINPEDLNIVTPSATPSSTTLRASYTAGAIGTVLLAAFGAKKLKCNKTEEKSALTTQLATLI